MLLTRAQCERQLKTMEIFQLGASDRRAGAANRLEAYKAQRDRNAYLNGWKYAGYA